MDYDIADRVERELRRRADHAAAAMPRLDPAEAAHRRDLDPTLAGQPRHAARQHDAALGLDPAGR